MRRGAASCLAAALVAGPTVLAFFSGGFFPTARFIAGIGAWALLAGAALAVPRHAPAPARARWVALGALAGLGAWTALSAGWTLAPGAARGATELVLVFLPAAGAAPRLLRPRGAARAAEVGLAAGAFVVIAYGLAGRLLPGLVHLQASARAGGRLEQPLTYWNATGALAAVGLVLAVRIAGDRSRTTALRATATAAAPVLALGVYLSFS